MYFNYELLKKKKNNGQNNFVKLKRYFLNLEVFLNRLFFSFDNFIIIYYHNYFICKNHVKLSWDVDKYIDLQWILCVLKEDKWI